MANPLGFGAPIAGNLMTQPDFLRSAAEMPLSTLGAFGSQSEVSLTDSPSLGTTIMGTAIDPGRRSPDMDSIFNAVPGGSLMNSPLMQNAILPHLPSSMMESDDQLRARGEVPMTKEQFDTNDPTPGMQYDQRMTVSRFNAIKDYQGWKDYKQRQIDRSDHPIASFLGGMAGGLPDPVNFIPVIGPEMRAAMVARWGLAGAAGVSAADAALNTAVASSVTKSFRNSIGDTTSWEDVVNQSAMGALMGATLGGAGHLVGGFLRNRRVNTLARTADARSVLDDAVSGLVDDDAVALSPRSQDTVLGSRPDVADETLPTLPDKEIDHTPETAALRDNIQAPSETWAPESVARTETGDLIPVFHGTVNKFEEFDPAKLGEETGAGSAKQGFFFTQNRDVAAGYAEDIDGYKENALGRVMQRVTFGGFKYFNEALLKLFGSSAIEKGRVITANLDVRNPKVVDYGGREINEKEVAGIIHDAKAEGHDAVQFKNISDPGYTQASEVPADNWVVFDPKQIKIVDHGDPVLNQKLASARAQAAKAVAPPAFSEPARDPSSPLYNGPEDPEVTEAAREASRVSSLETMAHDYGVDVTRDTSSMEAKQIEQEGRLSDTDKLALKDAADGVQKAEAWAEALKAAATCVLGG